MKRFLIILCILVAAGLTVAEERSPRQPRCRRATAADANASVEKKNVQEQKAPVAECPAPAQEKSVQEPKKEKPDYRNVIVDTWLVKVDADALYKSGVKPLSEKDKENVSIMNLLWCLSEPNNGEVIVSATTVAIVGRNVENEFSNTIYNQEKTEAVVNNGSRPIVSRSFRPLEQKAEFSTLSYILENKQMMVEWSFLSHFIYGNTSEENPPNMGYVKYQNSTVVTAKKPVIVAQTQMGDDMFFLVIRAEIVD